MCQHRYQPSVQLPARALLTRKSNVNRAIRSSCVAHIEQARAVQGYHQSGDESLNPDKCFEITGKVETEAEDSARNASTKKDNVFDPVSVVKCGVG